MNPSVMRVCSKHGLTDHRLGKDGRARCRQCSVAAVTKRRRLIKQQAIEYKGGVCAHCGNQYPPEVFDFHHTDPREKDFGISSKGSSLGWETIQKELDKCVMLCANCHRMEHARLNLGV